MMEIKWANVLALALIIVASVLFVQHSPDVAAAMSTLGDIGAPGVPMERQMKGLIVLAVLCAVLVAVLRILINANERKNK